jgi:hypothetical protein
MPVSSEQYTRVMGALLRYHPNARLYGLNLGSEVLQIDSQGSLLWYLSDTLNLNNSSAITGKSSLGEQDFIDDAVKRFLNQYAFTKTTEYSWAGGPTKLKIAGVILETTSSDDPARRNLGWKTLLAMIIPLDASMQVEFITKLLRSQGFLPGKLQSVAIFLRRSSVFILIFQAVISSLLFIYSLGLVESNVEGAGFLTLPSFIALFSTLSESYRNFVYTVIKKTTLFIAFRPAMLQNSSRTRAHVHDVLKNEFSTDAKFARSLIETSENDRWVDLTLQSSRSVTKSVILSMLQLIRDPDIQYRKKEQIFRWLCRVRVL